MVHDKTICAIATNTGGAIGIVRVSGNQAIAITDRIFTSAGKADKSLAEQPANSITFGHITNAQGGIIDEVLVSIFRAPHSYTGEDSVEISCHGSAYIMGQVLQALINNGCTQAAPGEFTMRAFLNGKMDLSQAEAVADLIASTNRATHQTAMAQLRGHFSLQLSQLRDKLLHLTSLMELELDFSDHEELEFANRDELTHLLHDIDYHICKLSASFASGKAIKAGIPVAIVGKTNVGKSTLLNLLMGEEKAIVSDIHGTTRDVIEDTTDINGVTFRFIDTAGIRQTDDHIEQLGIERTFKKMAEATIVLWILDYIPEPAEIENMFATCSDKHLIIVNNKTDVNDYTASLAQCCPTHHVIGISAKWSHNIDSLKSAIYQAANIPEINENDVIVTTARHYEALQLAHQDLQNFNQGLQAQLPTDLLCEELRSCLHHLAEITGGEITTDETLKNIFSHFCIGK